MGARKIDMHMVGMEALGVHFHTDHGYIEASTPNGLHGAYVALDFPSVGATENTMMCAVTAKGQTVIENAAREPEIEDLANMLNSMGARISGAGTAEIIIDGVELSSLHPCEHSTVGDRIEAGTFLVGGALTGGPVTVRGIDPSFLRMALMKLSAMGCSVDVGDDSITVSRKGPLLPTDIQTLPHPGFPTDLQAQFMLLASVASGNSVITENVFENRFMFAAEIGRMGAEITIEDHHAVVEGVPSLQGASVKATDLRCGAALVLAGIFAEGETQVHNIYHIDRGYEDYVGKLTAWARTFVAFPTKTISTGSAGVACRVNHRATTTSDCRTACANRRSRRTCRRPALQWGIARARISAMLAQRCAVKSIKCCRTPRRARTALPTRRA